MKIALYYEKSTFAERWKAYCERNNIDYKIVNVYDSDIIQQLEDCDAFLWHHNQSYYKDLLFAKQLLYSLQFSGKKVFPDFNTGWHFDDKVGQKYLLESLKIPFAPSYVFYSKKDALRWVESTTFPKVFKLRGGAGSRNVMLAKNKKEAISLIRRAFGRGFSQFNRIEYLKDRVRKYKLGLDTLWGVIKGLARIFIITDLAKMRAPEKGYVLFQDFIPNNKFDIRLVIIGDKAFAIKRMTRKGDFRASGSGVFHYDKNEFDINWIKMGFDVNKKIKSQSLALDIVFDAMNNPLIVEMSYGFVYKVYNPKTCQGYWTSDLEWHEGYFNPQEWMIENLISEVTAQSNTSL